MAHHQRQRHHLLLRQLPSWSNPQFSEMKTCDTDYYYINKRNILTRGIHTGFYHFVEIGQGKGTLES